MSRRASFSSPASSWIWTSRWGRGRRPPARLDFGAGAGKLGFDFATLAPEVNQTFFIGDGETATGETQIFFAPSGATHLALGFVDAFGFSGDQGAYNDNPGEVEATVNLTPVPVPGALPMLATTLAAFGLLRRRAG